LLFFCGDNYSYVHIGIYILVELSLLATFVGWSESSREQKFQDAKVPWSKSSKERKFQGSKVPHLELSLPGANGLGSEKSIIQCRPIRAENRNLVGAVLP